MQVVCFRSIPTIVRLTIIITCYDFFDVPCKSFFLILSSVKRNIMKKNLLLSLLSAFSPFLVFAHEGHGHTHGFTITHYFVEPEHLIVILGIFTATFVYWRYFRKKNDEIEKVL